MDTTAERQRLESEKRAIQAYLDHPITQEIFQDNEETQQALINVLTNVPIHDMESFFKHFEAVGHLRGLRQSRQLAQDSAEAIERQLKELPNE
jgi:hypothetical protein